MLYFLKVILWYGNDQYRPTLGGNLLMLNLPLWTETDVTPVSPGKESSEELGIGIRDWLMLLFVSLQKMSVWLLLLLVLDEVFGAQSSFGCFFWMSEKRVIASIYELQHYFGYSLTVRLGKKSSMCHYDASWN